MAAALWLVLLPLVMLGGDLRAQNSDTTGEAQQGIRTIRNTAAAQWTVEGRAERTTSNEVTLDVDIPPFEIRAFRQISANGSELNYQAPVCGASTDSGGDASSGADEVISQTVEETRLLRAGRLLIFEVRAVAANIDPNVVDVLDVIVTTSIGDRETATIFETAPNSGTFVGQFETLRESTAAILGDCRLSVSDGSTITIAALGSQSNDALGQVTIDVLADPFGIVFDSETGEAVSGARVTLVDGISGLPATVFAEDGTTSWPSSVISGQPITDGNGRVIEMGAGEYWFPLVPLGRYRLIVDPPNPYIAPSVVQPSEIEALTRPDGSRFIINDASYGGDFVLSNEIPVRIDIPLDRPGNDLSINKTASRTEAVPGDVVFYTINVINTDRTRLKREVSIADSPSKWLRLRPDTIKVDGRSAPELISVAPDGSSFEVDLGTLAAGASSRVTYAMAVRPDAPPDRIVNEAVTTDLLGNKAKAQAALDIQRETIADRMTIVGRVTTGSCLIDEPRIGIPGVRIMLEDGSFTITDADGRYHFEGVVPGTHVVAVSTMTLPEGGELVDCHRSTRNAGSNSSRFVIGRGGSLFVADFHVSVPEKWKKDRPQSEGSEPSPISDLPVLTDAMGEGRSTDLSVSVPEPDPEASQPAETDWLALGDGPDGWLSPDVNANPRSPAVKVVIRHRKGQKVALRVDGKDVDNLSFDGTFDATAGRFAVSKWRGIPLLNERTQLEADIINSFGEISRTIKREVFFTSAPSSVEFLPEQSNLIADGRTRPVIAIRVRDRNGRPLREGVAGNFTLSAPYESAEQLDRQQLNQLTGLAPSAARWTTQGDDGIALIELAPTMVSGSVRLNFAFDDGEISRQQELEAWLEPGDIEWTIVGLAEGSIGARSVADNMERTGRFDSDLGQDARVALYAKGRVLGKYLLTIAYDSAKQREDQRALGTLDPNAYYTVFADGAARRFDAASRERLYVRIESATFFALYGDFITAFDQTRLARYNRTATGVRGEARFGPIKAQGFAAEVASRLRREEIQGQGITGPYVLRSRRIIPNSERVTIETRDRFRSELIVDSRVLTRFIDYDLDLLSGSIRFAAPVLSRDEDLNPQFIVIEYETDGLGQAELNAGVRADWTTSDKKVRVGVNAITDKGEGARTEIGALDLRAELGENTEVRAELGVSRSEGATASGWILEAQHQTSSLDVLAYARQVDDDYGIGQQNAVERGRRKMGVDGRVFLNEHLSVLGSVWQDNSLLDSSRRRAMQAQLTLQRPNTQLRFGIAHFDDRLADSSTNRSTVLEAGATQRLFDAALEVSASTAFALDKTESIDLPARHRLGVRYQISPDVRLIGTYELAEGENVSSRQLRGGFEVTPWTGGQIVTTIGQETIGEFGNRSFAAFGLSQNFQVTPELAIDATVDTNRTLDGAPDVNNLVNPLQPGSSGGQLTGNLSFEDFAALTAGAAWRKGRWSLTARGEFRDGELADRTGAVFGAIRQLGEGSVVGSGATWTRAENGNGSITEILDASIAVAHRPDDSEIAVLGKLEFRSDTASGAVSGDVAGAGRTALIVDGDAMSRRLVLSLSTNWSPREWDQDEFGVKQEVRRNEYTLFVGARYNFDEFEGTEFSGTTVLGGLDARFGIGENLEVGATATVRANVEDRLTSFAYGPTIGISPARDVLFTIGYNVRGFRDGDFSAVRNTDEGLFAAVRLKLDNDTFSFLGLGQRS